MNSQLKQIHPLAWTIIVGTIFGRMATSMSIPFLSIYLTQTMGASPSQTGVIVAVSALVGVFASFYGGYVSDRIGRKKCCSYPCLVGPSYSSALRWPTESGCFLS